MLKLHQKSICIIYHRVSPFEKLIECWIQTMEKNNSLSCFSFNDVKCIHKKTAEKLKKKSVTLVHKGSKSTNE